MATKIITKNSSTASAVPLATDLVQGELAVNVTDAKLYTKDSSGAVIELGASEEYETGSWTIEVGALGPIYGDYVAVGTGSGNYVRRGNKVDCYINLFGGGGFSTLPSPAAWTWLISGSLPFEPNTTVTGGVLGRVQVYSMDLASRVGSHSVDVHCLSTNSSSPYPSGVLTFPFSVIAPDSVTGLTGSQDKYIHWEDIKPASGWTSTPFDRVQISYEAVV